MQVAVIAPTDFYRTETISDRPLHMALAHLVLTDKVYRDVMVEMGQSDNYLILDNGAWEKQSSVDLEVLAGAAAEICANEVVLPDVLYNTRETIKRTFASIEFMKQNLSQDVKLGAVVQGTSTADILQCYLQFATHPSIDVIYIPKLMEDMWTFGGRFQMMMYLSRAGVLCEKPHHMLGVMRSPLELTGLTLFSCVRSVDTALPIHMGLRYQQMSHLYGNQGLKSKRTDNFFYAMMADLHHQQLSLIGENIICLDEICAGIEPPEVQYVWNMSIQE